MERLLGAAMEMRHAAKDNELKKIKRVRNRRGKTGEKREAQTKKKVKHRVRAAGPIRESGGVVRQVNGCAVPARH